jgi:citrate synthase
MFYCFVNPQYISEKYIFITDENFYHLSYARRVKKGEKVKVRSDRFLYIAVVEDIQKNQIKARIESKEEIRPWLDETLKAKNVVWGMGHREYSVKDPRANILTEMVQQLFDEREGGVTDIFEKAIELEKACEEKLSHKGVYPNVDFYSGILYKEMDIPTYIFTPIFAMSRVSGWLAHWIEQIQDNKIFRPTQNYVGSDDRAYIDISDR